jgi:hypothetical protein
MSDDIYQLVLVEDGIAEAWTRKTEEPQFRGILSSRIKGKSKWRWQVRVSIGECLTGALKVEFDSEMVNILRSVTAVTDVGHEDREVWVVSGTPSGADLVRSAARIVDAFEERVRESLQASGPRGAAKHVSIVVDWDVVPVGNEVSGSRIRLWRVDISPQSMAKDPRLPEVLRFLGDWFEPK